MRVTCRKRRACARRRPSARSGFDGSDGPRGARGEANSSSSPTIAAIVATSWNGRATRRKARQSVDGMASTDGTSSSSAAT
jgi:hypothetical protein